MSTTYTPTPAVPAPYTIPADGDDADAASVNVALQALGDGLQYVYERPGVIEILTDDGSPTFTTSSVTFVDVTGAAVNVTGASVGDVLLCTVTAVCTADGGGVFRAVVVDDPGGTPTTTVPNAGTFEVPSGSPFAADAFSVSGSVTFKHVMTATTADVKVQIRMLLAATDATCREFYITVTRYRSP